MSYSIEILHYGVQQVPGPQVFWQARWDEWVDFNYYVFLLRGEGRTVLVDCGIDDLRPFNAVLEPALGPRGTVRHVAPVESLLRERGIRPEDVDAVAVTHLHVDHVANAPLFPRARFLLSREGWGRFMELRRDLPAMVPDPIFPAEAVEYIANLDGERLVLLEDGETPLPGIEIRYVGGHTADCAAYLVHTEEGRVVLPSDTAWTYANLEEDHPVGSAVDIRQCYEAMRWARTAGDLLLPPHDPEVIQRYPQGIGVGVGTRP